MEIIKTKELEKKASELIYENIISLSKIKDKIIIAVPGGRSASEIFLQLREKDIPWNKTHWFMVDERWVEIEDKESNFKIFKEILGDFLIKEGKINEENLHPFLLDTENYIEELREYQDYFDIVLLSSGEDGHIASLFPNYSIKDKEEFFIEVDDSPKPPKKRISASRKLLERSKCFVLLFKGEGKKEAFFKFLDPKPSVENCPAKIVLEKESYVITDIEDKS